MFFYALEEVRTGLVRAVALQQGKEEGQREKDARGPFRGFGQEIA